jgi:hypothetical protein
MAMGRVTTAVLLACMCAGGVKAQDAAPSPVSPSDPAIDSVLTHRPTAAPAASETISLMVPKGTPVQVILDQEVRLGKVGQPIHGRVAEPVYAFDKLVIPAGTEVAGQITEIQSVSGGKRAAAALDADFTPARKVQVEFDELALPDGKRIPIRTVVTPGSGRTIQFVSAASNREEKKGVRDSATEKTRVAKEQAKQEWDSAMKQAKEPGRIRRLEHFAVGELPVHPQYIDAGTIYFAELQEPIDFGTEPLTAQMAASIGATPPEGSVVEARLVMPLSSATAHQGDAVEAMISRPLFDGDRLILPQGSMLQGSVIQVHPAHHPGRNGELRIVFHQLRLTDGVEQKVEASLAGVEAAKVDNVRLDSEGGAHATSPGARFLTTAVSVGLGGFSMIGDSGGGDIGHSTAGGAGGYKLIGIAMGAAIRSQPLGMAMGAFGASRSIYANFIARGHDVVFPKNTAMAIGIGTRPAGPAPGQPAAENKTKQ